MALHMYFSLLTLCSLFGTSFQQINKREPSPSTGSTCPDGWSQYQDTCYLWVKQWITWDEADTRCADLGGILAEPDTKENIEFLHNITGSWPRVWGWIGATDRQTEGTWVWSGSGRPVVSSPWRRKKTTLWEPGEPDNESFAGDKDCLSMSSGWFATTCWFGQPYICEKQASV